MPLRPWDSGPSSVCEVRAFITTFYKTPTKQVRTNLQCTLFDSEMETEAAEKKKGEKLTMLKKEGGEKAG